MRLNKYLARCGVTSRRKADEYITNGRVRVNGEIIQEMGYRINPEKASVTVDQKPIALPETYVYYLLNKPEQVLSTVDDPRDRQTVVELIDTTRRIYPVGRLDYDTTGVLLLTDDGDLTQQLTHPSNEITRVYEAVYEGILPPDAVETFSSGIDIGDSLPAAGDLTILWERKNSGAAHVSLHSGRYHEVKRIFEYFNCQVTRLHRIKFAGLDCGELSLGEYRQLTVQEVKSLKTMGSS